MELGAVGRALSLLEVLSKVKSSNLEALSKETGLPKATALRLLASLCEQGYVHRDDSDRYSLTLRMFSVGSRALGHVDLLDVAGPVAEALRDETGETVHIGILEGYRAVYVLKKESLYTIRMYSRVGRTIPLHCSAIGKCLLSDQNKEYIDGYIAEVGLKRYTKKTVCTPEDLENVLKKVKTNGYAVDDEEHEEGIYCIAAPIRDSSGEIVAAMSMSTPLFRLDRDKLEDLYARVKAGCDEISKALGYIVE